MIHKTQANPRQFVFPEGENEKILRACRTLVDEKIGKPILLGNHAAIETRAREFAVDVEGIQVIDPATYENREFYALELFRLRQRRGVTLQEAQKRINDHYVFGSMMVHMGDVDSLVSGAMQHYPDTIRPALQIVSMREGLLRVCGCNVLITPKGEIFFLADTSVNIEPTAEDLVEIPLCTAQMGRRFDIVPRLAMLCFSTFCSIDHRVASKVRKAVELIKFADPTMIVDSEIMADEAMSPEVIDEHYPFSQTERWG